MHVFGSNISSFQLNRASGGQRNHRDWIEADIQGFASRRADFESQTQLPDVEDLRA